MDSFIGWLLAMVFAVLIGVLAFNLSNRNTEFQLPREAWACTQSVVVNKELPRKEECTQYTMKSAEKQP